MRLSPRQRANRRNARNSTGPRTPAGKARAAQNALRHGLNVPLALDPSLTEEIEGLARLIVGKTDDPLRLQDARRIAEAELDVLRVRRARLALLADPSARVPRVSRRAAQRRLSALKRQPDWDGADAGAERLMETPALPSAKRTLEASFDVVAPQLAKLDRYERRALSRRKAAIREFEQNVGNLSQARSFQGHTRLSIEDAEARAGAASNDQKKTQRRFAQPRSGGCGPASAVARSRPPRRAKP